MSTLLLRLHSVAVCTPSRCTGSSCTLGMTVRAVGTKFQLADAMTKVIDATHFLIFRDFVLVVINDEMIVALKRKSD